MVGVRPNGTHPFRNSRAVDKLSRMRHLLLAIGVVVCLTFSAFAAEAPKSVEDLKRDATHIVVGKVEAAYSTERRVGTFEADRHWVVEMMVTAVEKGEGPRPGRVLYAKCWQPFKRL